MNHDDARLDQLVDFVVQIAAGDLAARLEPSGVADSIEAVAVGLNMLAEELEVLYAGLEQHVAERTASLEQAQAALRSQALTDALTGLANRTLLGDRIGQALARAQRGALPPTLLALDLDGFKLINDSLGHAGGDTVLVEVARRLETVARRTDTVARFGGDEFAILITDATSDAALRIAERALDVLRRPMRVGDQLTSAGASIGVCFGSRGKTPDSLLRDADTAMYAAKTRGRNNVQVFKPEMHAAALARVQIADELHTALRTHELTVHFQPLVDLASARVVGAEALVRWNHPRRGLVRPVEFVPVAEETGLIVEIGQRVTVEAIRQLAKWQKELVLPESFRLHVNVSPVEFRRASFAPFVRETLQRYGVPAASLVLEITENGLMTDEGEIAQTLHDLRSGGVGLAIDDFGTGYSSISYLRRLPVDSVKIDRSLVEGVDTDPQQRNLVAAVVALIDAVNLTPIAEGVETAGQATSLQALGCVYGQGYHFSRPVSAGEMTGLLRVDHVQRAGPEQPDTIGRQRPSPVPTRQTGNVPSL
ncbi:MAG TPA: EAL domain-containing protein [Candidatus Lustribacter sp.]|nr:EAL domain-containing protein [Candidatus Lustribacter sp.]